MKLEDLQPDATFRGILPDALVTVVSVAWHGSDALTLVYRAPNGRIADEILYRHDEPRLEIVETGRPWSFDGDGALFRLVAEAHRIRLAHLFDPVLAVHTSLVDPLPHQITAVYEAMLPRPAAALPAGRRSWRGEDDHGGAPHQRADRPRGLEALPHRLPRKPG
jgi:hypothetical protein